MITIFPIEDTGLENARKQLGVPADAILEAKDGEEVLGQIGFTVGPESLQITGISVSEAFMVDGLIRSAMSYAMQREIPLITAALEDFEPQFLAVGFIKKDGAMSLRLDTFYSNCQC